MKDKKEKRINVSMTDKYYNRVNKIAEDHGFTASMIVRLALYMFFKKMKDWTGDNAMQFYREMKAMVGDEKRLPNYPKRI